MNLSQHILLCVSLCLVVPTICVAKKKKSSGPATHKCGITNGYKLKTFVGGKAKVQLPCRYMLTKVMCNMETEVWAESSFSPLDGYTYVSSVGVTITRDVKDKDGNTVRESDTASINMDDFQKFIEGGDTEAPHWNTSGQSLLDTAGKGGSSWRLRDTYDEDKGVTVLKDGSGELAVALKYLNREKDKSKKGSLTVTCSSAGFKGLEASSGYLCGFVGNADKSADTKKTIKEAAAAIKLSTSDYIVYNMLVPQSVPQTNPLCEEAAELTSKCADPPLAVKTCGILLEAKSYAKCFVKNGIDPLAAYGQCIKWKCRRDVLSCRYLERSILTCPGKLKSELKCSGGGGGGGRGYKA